MPSPKDIRAGGAFVELGVKDFLDKHLQQAAAKLKAFGKTVTKIGAVTAAAGAAALAPLGGAVARFVETGDELNKLAARTGFTTEALSELKFAAEQNDVSFKGLGSAIFRATRRIANAATETGPAVRALKELGLSAKELSELSPEQQFEALVGALGGVANEGRRAQLAFEIFGDNARELTPLLAQGVDGIRALRQEARDLGLSKATADTQAAADLSDAINRVKNVVADTVFEIGAALAPTLLEVAGIIKRLAVVTNEWIADNRSLVVTIAAVAAGLVAAGTAIAGVGLAITAAGVALGAISTVVGALLSPVGLIAAGFAAAGAALVKWGDSLPVIRRLKGAIGELVDFAKGIGKSIADAVAAGDLRLAGQILFKGLEVAFEEGKAQILGIWFSLTGLLERAFLKVTTRIAQALTEVIELAKQTAADPIGFKVAEFAARLGAGEDPTSEATQALEEDLQRRLAESRQEQKAAADQAHSDVDRVLDELRQLQKQAAEAARPERLPPIEDFGIVDEVAKVTAEATTRATAALPDALARGTLGAARKAAENQQNRELSEQTRLLKEIDRKLGKAPRLRVEGAP